MAVYVIQAENGGPCKIGLAADPASRLREPQVGNPYALRVATTFDGGRDLERAFHAIFEKKRLSSEWFDVSPSMIKQAETTARQMAAPAPDVAKKPTNAAEHLKAAIATHGSQARVARLAGCSQQLVSQIVKGAGVTAEMAVAFERAGVSRHALRPDIFGPEQGAA